MSTLHQSRSDWVDKLLTLLWIPKSSPVEMKRFKTLLKFEAVHRAVFGPAGPWDRWLNLLLTSVRLV